MNQIYESNPQILQDFHRALVSGGKGGSGGFLLKEVIVFFLNRVFVGVVLAFLGCF